MDVEQAGTRSLGRLEVFAKLQLVTSVEPPLRAEIKWESIAEALVLASWRGKDSGRRLKKKELEASFASCLSLVVRLLGQGERSGFCSFFRLNHSHCENQILKESKDCFCSVF